MRRNVSATVKCPGCKLTTSVGFKEPKLFEPVIVKFPCSGCQSELMTKFSLPKKTPGTVIQPGQVSVAIRICRVSQFLIDILKEEAEHNSAEPA